MLFPLLQLTLLVVTLALTGGEPDTRPRHPLVRSLPQLTKQEDARVEAVVDRFIRFKTGKLPKSEEKPATDALNQLGPEALFHLVDGFNNSARLKNSCAAVTLGAKLEKIINQSSDLDLVRFVRENAAAGIDATEMPLPVLNALRSLQTTALRRQGVLAQRARFGPKVPAPSPGLKALGSMSLAELEKAADRERGANLRAVLQEVEKREGPQVFKVLVKAAGGDDPELRKFSKALLDRHADRQSPTSLKALLRHDAPAARAAAAKAVGAKELRYGPELIELLRDEDPAVHQAARGALRRLARGRDLGPEPDASFGDRETAARRWTEWWESQK